MPEAHVLCMLCMALFSCEKEVLFEEEIIEQEIQYQESIVIEVDRNDRVRTRGEGELEEVLKSYFSSLKNQKKVVKNKWGDINWTFSKFSTVTEQGELAIIPVATDKSEYTEALLLAFMPESGNKIFIKGYDRKDIVKLNKKKNAKKNKKGKMVELTKELGLGNLLVFDGEIYGSADCDLVDLLFEDEPKARNVNTRLICLPVWTANISCQTITVGSTTDPNQHSYTDCTTSYSIESVCSNGGVEEPTPTTPTPSGGGNFSNLGEDLITLNVKPCMQQIYLDLRKSAGSELKGVLSKLNEVVTDKYPVSLDPRLGYNWNVKMGDCTTPNSSACTGGVKGGVVTTTIDERENRYASDLSIARTFMHEAFHAYIRHDLSKRGLRSTTYAADITKLLELYEPSKAHHEIFIETNFVKTIASSLYSYAKSKGMHNVSRSYCEKLAWGGLQGTNAYKALSSSEKVTISAITAAEKDTLKTYGGHSTKSKRSCK